MVVVDEQHRFGVEQRDRLRAKAIGGITPHLLVMTATPIPRTVALTVYGDLETSTLRELPRGRQPITTNTIFMRRSRSGWSGRGNASSRRSARDGRPTWSPPASTTPTKNGRGRAADAGPPPPPSSSCSNTFATARCAGLRLGLMHGRLSGDEKDAVMSAFRAGEIDVLVCTTVIEVGVDVPNATVMFVMDADRFGISQLHQLRGRIGRGEHPSLCLLATKLPEESKAGARFKAVAGTLDGFELADLDLEERREGDVLGLNQSGRPITLRLLSLAEHRDIIEAAQGFHRVALRRRPELLGHPGIAILAAQFTDTERIEYLDKA